VLLGKNKSRLPKIETVFLPSLYADSSLTVNKTLTCFLCCIHICIDLAHPRIRILIGVLGMRIRNQGQRNWTKVTKKPDFIKLFYFALWPTSSLKKNQLFVTANSDQDPDQIRTGSGSALVEKARSRSELKPMQIHNNACNSAFAKKIHW